MRMLRSLLCLGSSTVRYVHAIQQENELVLAKEVRENLSRRRKCHA